MPKITTEVYITKKKTTKEDWTSLINSISTYEGFFHPWKIIVSIIKNKISYYIITTHPLPANIYDQPAFLLKETSQVILPTTTKTSPYIHKITHNIISLYQQLDIKNNKHLHHIELTLHKLSTKKIITTETLYINHKNTKKYKNILAIAPTLLAIDFEENQNFLYKSPPKYLDCSKAIALLKKEDANSLFKIDTFPYLQGNYYLTHNNYNFDKHSIILGSSGSGKSKFISLLINNIKTNSDYKYRIVLIDPHAALEKEIGGLGKVIDFKTDQDSINLFMNKKEDVVAETELLLELLKSLMEDQYNAKSERVLRHSIYLLLTAQIFNFQTLRKLLLNIEFRTTLIKDNEHLLPISVTNFFLTDFNELKTTSYMSAISPIISFIDEMELLPTLNNQTHSENLETVIKNNFLTIFSLDRTKLGKKIVKTISGLIMQQLLTLIEQYTFDEHLIFIIDEIALVENPLISKFLSEARKYNLSLIIAGQYLDQISKEIKNSIFANVVNYYIFKVSKVDATLLVDNFNMKIPLDDSKDRKIKLLTELNSRECIIRIAKDSTLFPAMKGTTQNFSSVPRKEKQKVKRTTSATQKNSISSFNPLITTKLKDILVTTSSSRKVVK